MTTTTNESLWETRNRSTTAVSCPTCRMPVRVACHGGGRTCAARYRLLARLLAADDDGRQMSFANAATKNPPHSGG